MRLAFGVDQLDGGLRLGREQAVEDLAAGGRQGVLHEVPLDAPARVEDVDQQLLARVRAHAGQVGADLAPFAAVNVALGALLGVDHLAFGRVAPFQDDRAELIDDLLAVGVGQAASSGDEGLGPRGDRPVGVGGEGLGLRERELRERHVPLLDAFEERDGPFGAREQGLGRVGADGRGHRAELGDQGGADLGGFAPTGGVDQAARQGLRRPRRDQLQERPGRPGVERAELDQPAGRVDPGRVGLLLVLRKSQEGRGDLGRMGPRSPLKLPAECRRLTSWARAAGEGLSSTARRGTLSVGALGQLPVLGPPLGQTSDDGVGHGQGQNHHFRPIRTSPEVFSVAPGRSAQQPAMVTTSEAGLSSFLAAIAPRNGFACDAARWRRREATGRLRDSLRPGWSPTRRPLWATRARRPGRAFRQGGPAGRGRSESHGR